jgi:hypothetical protein
MIRVPGYMSRGPGFDYRSSKFFLRSSWSGMGSTQPREDNWGTTLKKRQRLQYRKPRLMVVGSRCAYCGTPSTCKCRNYFAGHSVGTVRLRNKTHRVPFFKSRKQTDWNLDKTGTGSDTEHNDFISELFLLWFCDPENGGSTCLRNMSASTELNRIGTPKVCRLQIPLSFPIFIWRRTRYISPKRWRPELLGITSVGRQCSVMDYTKLATCFWWCIVCLTDQPWNESTISLRNRVLTRATRRNIPEDAFRYSHRHENHKYYLRKKIKPNGYSLLYLWQSVRYSVSGVIKWLPVITEMWRLVMACFAQSGDCVAPNSPSRQFLATAGMRLACEGVKSHLQAVTAQPNRVCLILSTAALSNVPRHYTLQIPLASYSPSSLLLIQTCIAGRYLWSSGHSSWLQTKRSRVRLPAMPDFLSSSRSRMRSTQPLRG